jgi:WD40 repeat protein
VAHELGHAFDLNNDFRDEKYIMSYRAGNQGQLSACAAGFLAVHPYFNADIGIGPDESSSTIHLVSPPGYAPGSQSIPVRVRIVNSAGLHQVLFVVTTQLPHFEAGHAEVKTCRSFSGERSAVVEFDYDGLIPSNGLTSLANPIVHRVRSWAFDTSGRFSALGFSLYQISDRHIDTLDKPGVVTSLAFSPSSTALAAGYSLVKFWDLRTRQIIASFEPESPAWAVAISPDGATLASEHNGTVTLWDLASRTDYAELVGQPGDSRFSSVAFSPPDGATLAALSGNSTVKLWNLETRANYADLDHDSDVTTMAFSPDRERLASGLNDGVIHIWDPATGKHLAAMEGPSGLGRCRGVLTTRRRLSRHQGRVGWTGQVLGCEDTASRCHTRKYTRWQFHGILTRRHGPRLRLGRGGQTVARANTDPD